MSDDNKSEIAKERLRRSYRPTRVRVLFIGEAPPASGRFFYQADSGLYLAIRSAFAEVFSDIADSDFLESFREMGCYLVDLCGMPVDRLPRDQRVRARLEGEVGLAKMLKQLHPEIVITVLRSITSNVRRSQERAEWSGTHMELPYPGRWKHHRTEFIRELALELRRIYGPRREVPTVIRKKDS
jgi:hypothetical protein